MMASLSSDILYDILRRLDGANLARAGCTCSDFLSISKEEKLWEDVCHSLWPSTCRDDVRCLISSIGGFRKFYADCFPLIIVNRDVSGIPHLTDKNPQESEIEWFDGDGFYDYSDGDDDGDELDESVSPSDFVSMVDVKYKDRTIYSKVVHGIPGSDGFQGWFYNCPFRIDMLGYSNPSDTELVGELTLSNADGLPLVTSMERERKDGKLWRELYDNVQLSWIIVNTRVKQAANLASWSPLRGQRHWPTDNDFFIRFGSILPARGILRCQLAECILVMKFRGVDAHGDAHGGEMVNMMTGVELTELSMQLEDMGGAHLNGKNSLLVLKQGLSCHRSRNYSQVLESSQMYLKAQMELKEEKMRNDIQLDRMCILCGVVVFLAFFYWFL